MKPNREMMFIIGNLPDKISLIGMSQDSNKLTGKQNTAKLSGKFVYWGFSISSK